MKKNYILKLLIGSILLLSGNSITAQSVEVFETEANGSSTFTDAGQTFTITSTTGENYNVFSDGYMDNGSTDTCAGCGWNGSAADNKFIDNTGGANNNGNGNGSSFTITTGGADIGVTSLYLFCSTTAIAPHSGSVTITGKKGGIEQYTFTKSSGFANVTTFTPNNGFTFIDFATEGSSDFTQTKIDELVFASTGNLDYMALDAFSWAPGNTLSAEVLSLSSQISFYPNPSKDFIKVSGLTAVKNYKIYNILAHKMEEGSISDNSQMDIRNLANGLYFVHFDNGVVKKILKK